MKAIYMHIYKEMMFMLKDLAWNTFKNTGNINTFLELKQVTNIEENIKADNYEITESKRNNNSGENSIRF